jgi:hypothetical protein
MNVLFKATGRHFSEMSIGATHTVTNLDQVAHFISADAADLEARVLAKMQAFTAAQAGRLYLASASLAGSGDGSSFCVALVGNPDSSGGVWAAPVDQDSIGSKVFFYQGETEAEIQIQCAKALTRVAAFLAEGSAALGTYVDWQLAGSAQGRVQMGMIIVHRETAP